MENKTGAKGKIRCVLYVLDSFPKISETFILNEITGLIDRGVEVRILALRNPSELQVNQKVIDYGLLQVTTYLNPFYILKNCKTRVIGPILTKFVHLTQKLFPELLFRLMVRYYAWRNRKADMIQSHFAFEAAEMASKIGGMIGKPFTFTAHAFEIFSRSSYEPDRLRRLARESAAVITPSEYNRAYIAEQSGCDPKKIRIVRATIDPALLETARPPDDGTISIVTIGRLVEKKGVEYLLEAHKEVIARYPEARLVIIGDGPLKEALKDRARRLGIQELVDFTGALPNQQCFEILRSSTVFAAPCVIAEDGDRDVCPLTLQEAMAMGVPVVSTRVGSIPELVEDGQSGLLVNDRDEKALAAAILRLIEDKALRDRLIPVAREKIEKEFNIPRQTKALHEIWEALAAERSGVK